MKAGGNLEAKEGGTRCRQAAQAGRCCHGAGDTARDWTVGQNRPTKAVLGAGPAAATHVPDLEFTGRDTSEHSEGSVWRSVMGRQGSGTGGEAPSDVK